ncbi:SDR family oxidoreductase [Halobacteriales archaeon Cl-PHB]
MTDETVLITGCSSGIGNATARLFHEEGWHVYATSRDEADLADLAELGIETDELDVTKGEDIERLVDRIVEADWEISCLVNNAGYGQYGPMEDVPADELHRQFDVNVYGPHRLARAVLPHMRDREDGTIVNVSSVSGKVSAPGTGAYSASKAALEMMSDAMRGEVDGFGVDVVLVQPGPVATEFTDRYENELLEGLDRRTDVYGWIYDTLEDASVVGGSAPIAAEPERVASVIHDAAEATDPKARYPVGRVAQLMLLSRFLPDDLRDVGYRLYRKVT